MRTPRLAACIVAMGIAAVSSAQIPNITTTPSHTSTPTSTPTPTATPTTGPTVIPTPMPTPWAVIGPEFQVNTTTTGNQFGAAVAIGASDGFVVAWTDDQQDGNTDGIFARRFDAAGIPLSGEFQVNTYTTGRQYGAALASDASGNFVVVWSSDDDPTGGTDVFARRFDSAGNGLGPEFMVNTHTTGFQFEPDVSTDGFGDFVVVWTTLDGSSPQDGDLKGIFARRYDSDGTPLTGEFQVNTYTTGQQFAPAVDKSPGGDFVVVWSSEGQDGSSGGIFGQRYDFEGSPAGVEFRANTFTIGEQAGPDIAMNEVGGFVVTWAGGAIDGDQLGVLGRIFSPSPDGSGLGVDFQINTHATSIQFLPRVAAGVLAQGPQPFSFIVTWQGFGQDDPASPELGVFGQRFANAPSPTSGFYLANPPRIGSEYQINTYTAGNQQSPDVAVDGRGQFVIAWDSTGQDGAGYGVFARRFGYPDPQPAEVDQRPSGGSSNVNGMLEPGERVAFDPSWTNTGDNDIPLQGAISNLTGPPGPTYAIDDASADYGNIDNQQTAACFDCYEVTVSGVRPIQHWDATVDETLTSTGPLGPSQPRSKTWALHVGGSFNDVPTDVFYPFIENIFHNRVTAGGGCGAGNFCGNDGVLRQQMAVFLLKARNGADFVPPPATGAVFDDVPASNPFAPWIEELERIGVTVGCAAPPPPVLPSYCPTTAVNRQQMAVFLLKTLYGGQFSLGGCGGVFDDVPCTNPFAPYIEYLTLLNIAAGCQASPPLYCPTDPTLRRQMAVFLVKTFRLNLYGPH